MILDKINKPNDIKNINPADYSKLASEIRKFMIEKVSCTGGHLASNLGVVELTMALHLALDFPEDKIIWDVGHQSYTHKILTGRKDGFDSLRKFKGMSGFPKTCESEADCFNTGHSSTSISAALGLATARDIKKEHNRVVAVIGDGAMTGGMAYEALNNASHLKGNLIVILNDNEMSISENVGSVANLLTQLRTSDRYYDFKEKIVKGLYRSDSGKRLAKRLKKTKDNIRHKLLPGDVLESLGLTYFGPIDGHDINGMLHVINTASRNKGTVVIHVKTKKGKGYVPAENFPNSFHGVSTFDVETGQSTAVKKPASYAHVFSEHFCQMADTNKKLVGITAAMSDGTGLIRFSKEFPDRFFDVGIAEQHATTFAAGLAAGGLKPFFAVYSSFLQRAYDQMLHDVSIQKLPVVFAIDHGGLVGADGETHQGIFDISYLTSIPGMTVFAPKNKYELEAAMDFAAKFDGPIALRYPSGSASESLKEFNEEIKLGKSELIYKEKDIALLALGRMNEIAVKVRENLKEEGYNVTLVNSRFVAPFDKDMIQELQKEHKLLVTLEENILSGGYGEHVSNYVMQEDIKAKVLTIALPNDYVEHGNVNILFAENEIDADSVTKRVKAAFNKLD